MADKLDRLGNKYTIGVDFDGVVHTYTGWTGDIPTGKPIIGAKEALLRLKEKYRLVVFSTRLPALVLQWLKDNDMENIFDDVTDHKDKFLLIIDDRAICFKGNWDKTLEKVFEFKAYWAKEGEQ